VFDSNSSDTHTIDVAAADYPYDSGCGGCSSCYSPIQVANFTVPGSYTRGNAWLRVVMGSRNIHLVGLGLSWSSGGAPAPPPASSPLSLPLPPPTPPSPPPAEPLPALAPPVVINQPYTTRPCQHSTCGHSLAVQTAQLRFFPLDDYSCDQALRGGASLRQQLARSPLFRKYGVHSGLISDTSPPTVAYRHLSIMVPDGADLVSFNRELSAAMCSSSELESVLATIDCQVDRAVQCAGGGPTISIVRSHASVPAPGTDFSGAESYPESWQEEEDEATIAQILPAVALILAFLLAVYMLVHKFRRQQLAMHADAKLVGLSYERWRDLPPEQRARFESGELEVVDGIVRVVKPAEIASDNDNARLPSPVLKGKSAVESPLVVDEQRSEKQAVAAELASPLPGQVTQGP
jgi:hypothetical protein